MRAARSFRSSSPIIASPRTHQSGPFVHALSSVRIKASPLFKQSASGQLLYHPSRSSLLLSNTSLTTAPSSSTFKSYQFSAACRSSFPAKDTTTKAFFAANHIPPRQCFHSSALVRGLSDRHYYKTPSHRLVRFQPEFSWMVPPNIHSFSGQIHFFLDSLFLLSCFLTIERCCHASLVHWY